ncbi:MAG: glycosyltransferase [Clostridia bacterium]|jgi:glycosyltransferase involved in cell wall biosynthesis|nr:glycosyltransferase [Clostridia bacterium]
MLIIYPPTVHWDYMKARPQQLMTEFATQGDKVIFCEPGKHIKKHLRKIREGLWINYGAPIDEWPKPNINEKTILWISYPGNVSYVGKYQEDMVVYDVLDFPDYDFEAWKPHVEELLKRCNLVLTVSRPLFDYFRQSHFNVHIVRNAVDYEYFAQVKPSDEPFEMNQISKPIVGYYGALADWIDWELITLLALKNPDISFVLIGPVIGMQAQGLPKLPNLHFLGRKPYSDLANYAQWFNVCIFPFKKTKMTEYVNPVKVYEYLAMGKPIVAIDLPEIVELGPIVSVAKDGEEFHQALLNCLNDNSPSAIDCRKSFARENTWEIRVKQIKNLI